MNVELVGVTKADRELVKNLAQLYTYDFSEFEHFDVERSGRYDGADRMDPLREGRRTFIVRVDGRPAGFAMVGMQSTLTQDNEVRDMNEFFVMRKYRR